VNPVFTDRAAQSVDSRNFDAHVPGNLDPEGLLALEAAHPLQYAFLVEQVAARELAHVFDVLDFEYVHCLVQLTPIVTLLFDL